MKILLLIILFFIGGIAQATNYYFSDLSGDDSRTSVQAQNSATPWKTVTKLNSFFSSLVAGDSILFKRGDTFYGSIVVSYSGTAGNPIVYGAYGTGAQPIITGLTTLTSWTSSGGGIYQSYCPSCKTTDNMVVMDGVEQAIGRYPNTDYLTFESFSSNTSITDNELTGTPHWSGEVVIRKTDWIIDRNTITSHSGSTINYTSGSSYPGIAGFGYFIQKDSLTLDQLGEWFLSPSKNMKMYFGGTSPGSYTIKTTTIDTLVTITSHNYITFDNLYLEGANVAAVMATSTNYVTVQNCTINFSGTNAITLGGTSSHFSATGNTINHTNNNAISTVYLSTQTYSYVGYNTVKNTGAIPGMGLSDDGSYNALAYVGSKAIYEYNNIDTTGYLPINFGGDSTIVRNNYINYFCFLKQDGGGIYTFTSGTGVDSVTYIPRIVSNNIVLNGIGAPLGTNSTVASQANGIYMDNNASQVTISGNTLGYCASNGIILNSSHSITIRDNTLYNNDGGLYMAASNDEPVYNIIFKNNVIAKASNVQTVLNTGNNIIIHNSFTFFFFPNTYYSIGSIDSNYYSSLSNDSSFLLVNKFFFNGAVLRNFADWKTFTSADTHSTLLGVASRFEYNATNANKTIVLDGIYVDVKNNLFGNSVTLGPYSSIVLVKIDFTVLPLQFLDFHVYKAGFEANLEWTRANEGNTLFFEIERSADGIHFSRIDTIHAKNIPGNTSVYSYKDIHPLNGNNFYRLKQVDSNGDFSYSQTVKIFLEKQVAFQISPNPIHNQLRIVIDKVQNSQYRILLIQTILGNTVKVIPVNSSSDFITIDMSNFPNAPYIVSLICKDFTLSKKIVKCAQ